LTEHLTQQQIIESPDEFCRLVSVETITGEVTVSVRKGKLFVFYEFDLKINWEGCRNSSSLVSGTVHIPNIETDDDELEATVTSKEKGKDADYFISIIKTKGLNYIKNEIAILVEEIKKQHEKKVIKPVPTTQTTATKPIVAPSSGTASITPTTQTKAPPKESKTTTLSVSTFLSASAQEVYNALLDGPRNSAFTQSSCVIDPKVGGKITLFSGSIQGEFLELSPPKKIRQKWRMTSWPSDCTSEVLIELKEEKGGVKLILSQKGVPVDEVEKTEKGWTDHYLRGLKIMHNWGNMYGE
jgi:activator of HSP90 ATPase